MVTAAMNLKDACSLEENYDNPRQHIKEQRHYFANKCPSGQSFRFSLLGVDCQRLKGEVKKVKEESEKVTLKLNIQKTKIKASGPIIS